MAGTPWIAAASCARKTGEPALTLAFRTSQAAHSARTGIAGRQLECRKREQSIDLNPSLASTKIPRGHPIVRLQVWLRVLISGAAPTDSRAATSGAPPANRAADIFWAGHVPAMPSATVVPLDSTSGAEAAQQKASAGARASPRATPMEAEAIPQAAAGNITSLKIRNHIRCAGAV